MVKSLNNCKIYISEGYAILYENMKYYVEQAHEHGVIKQKNGIDVQSLTFLGRCICEVD